MSEHKPLEVARLFLGSLARADLDAWPALVAEDVVMMFPFAPPGLPRKCVSRAQCAATVSSFFSLVQRFEWHDLDLHAGMEPELVFGTARSEVTTVAGRPYRNDYCFILRVENDKVSEYREYFDPLPAIEAFALRSGT
jgi:uncharacterized protein